MKNLCIFTLLLITFTSCEKAILGEDEVNNPENNFQIFWDDFDQHYGLFTARGWDWDSIYQVYQPQVTPLTTDDELWEVFRSMVDYLDDSHTFVYQPHVRFFSGNSSSDEQVESEFSLEVLEENYLDNLQFWPNIPDERIYKFGQVRNKDIGYIYLNAVEFEDPAVIDEVLDQIGNHQAIILDLRNNHGGSDDSAAELAGRFADGEHFIYTVQEKNGPARDDFTAPREYFTQRKGRNFFDKPLILLTDRITVSAAEILTSHLKAFELVTQIGDRTSGDFSDTGMRRFLPNGWQYQYSIMMFLQPDGSTLDGVGHLPNIQVRNSAMDIEAGNDLVMERALNFLFEEYGIE